MAKYVCLFTYTVCIMLILKYNGITATLSR